MEGVVTTRMDNATERLAHGGGPTGGGPGYGVALALLAVLLAACVRVGAGTTATRAPRPAAVASPSPVSDARPPAEPSPDTTPRCPPTPAQKVLDLVNRQRVKVGLPPLKVDLRLVAAARKHAEGMAQGGPFGHVGSNGSQPKDRITLEGYRWLHVGENVAAGMPTAEKVVADWMGSPPHRENILSGYEDTGIAYVHMRFSLYGTYWVQEFGTRRPSEKPQRALCNP